ncbi:MAG: hypothetical protein H0T49_03640 [Chloroflexia bacterium]|nr:hypothetical protein [Chloroflexia bacterium]
MRGSKPVSLQLRTRGGLVRLVALTIALLGMLPLAAPAGAQTGGPGAIELHLSACPAGYSGTDYFNVCHENGIDSVRFTISGSNAFVAQGDTAVFNGTGPGIVEFPNLAAATYNISDGLPGDVLSRSIYCANASTQVQVPAPLNNRGEIDLVLAAGVSIVCDWYIIPDLQTGGTGSIEVHAAGCPAGYTGTTAFEDCHDSGLDNVVYTIAGPGGYTAQGTTDVPQTPGPGIVRFTNLGPGTYRLDEEIPGDFVSLRIFCSDATTKATVAINEDANGASLNLATGQQVICDWYVIPDQQSTPSTLTITKFTCPSGFSTSGATATTFANGCPQTTNGVVFTLSQAGGYSDAETTGNAGSGAVAFSGLAPGSYNLAESVPAGIGSTYAFCQIDGGAVYAKTISGGKTSFGLAGQDVACRWYNVLASAPAPTPVPAGPTGSITVHEFRCPADKAKIDDFSKDCTAGSTGATFELSTPGGAAFASGQTNANGILAFVRLANGAYDLDLAQGTWCFATSDRVDASGNLLVANGGNSDVFIYQCTAVTALPSTGTGSTPGTGFAFSALELDLNGWTWALGGGLMLLAIGGGAGFSHRRLERARIAA